MKVICERCGEIAINQTEEKAKEYMDLHALRSGHKVRIQ